MKRLFIALPVEPQAAALLSGVRESLGSIKTVKRVSAENYHITMKFIGEVDDARGAELTEAFKGIEHLSLAGSSKIEYTIKGISTFQFQGLPSVIWCGIEADMARLRNIFNAVDFFCSAYRIQKEKRPFRPHLTIARVKNPISDSAGINRIVESHRMTVFGTSEFERLSLYESVSAHGGPVYTEISTLKFSDGN